MASASSSCTWEKRASDNWVEASASLWASWSCMTLAILVTSDATSARRARALAWRAVTCAISWAITAATSEVSSASPIRPRLT